MPTDPDDLIATARADPAGTLVVLDVDGTVSPIAASPGDATVSEATRALLERIGERYELWFVSGRDADDAKRLAGVEPAGYVGAHGLEVLDGDGLRALVDSDVGAQLDEIARAVGEEVPEAAPHIERKRWGISFHYRAAPEMGERLRASIESHLVPELRLQPGKMVYEVRPALERDKGSALAWLVERRRPRRVIVAGDDLTDVAMFEALARLDVDGLRIAVVGSEAPEALVERADTTVEGVAELERLLSRLLD